MPIYKGDTKIDVLYKGANISKVYKGGQLVYEKLLPVDTVLFENSTPGAENDFTIPAGVKAIFFEIRGAQGYGGSLGGKVTGYIKVTPGDQFHFTTAYTANTDRITPAYNASDIRIPSLSTDWRDQRIATAGGGGSHSSRNAAGGIGGYNATQGKPGYRGDAGGFPGTQTANGAGGVGQPVSVGHFHNGNAGGSSSLGAGFGGAGISCGYCGQTGCGGAGWFPGGSGAGDWNKNGGYAAGGGGGASNVNSAYIINPAYEDGVSKAGYIKITVANI